MSDVSQEIEWQFEVADLERARAWLEQRLGKRFGAAARLQDDYLDTEDRRFFRAGRTLRLRTSGATKTATIKGHAPSKDGLRRRLEINEPAAEGDLSALPGEVGRRVRDLAGRRPVATVFTIRTKRRVLKAEVSGAQIEAALDETATVRGRRAHAIGSRVEIEVGEVNPEIERLIAEFRADLGATPCAVSKPEAARLAWGLPEAPAPYVPEPVEPRDPAGLAARKVLRKHLEAMLAREPGTRLGDDIEDLHQMRVATRRLRAALSLFREVLPVRSEAVREQFRWLGTLLGDVRDLDVQIERIEAWREQGDVDADSAEYLTGRLEERRVRARSVMLAGLDSARYDRLVASAQRLLESGLGRRGPAHAPVALVGPSLIERRHRAVRKAGDKLDPGSDPAEFHAMRIRVKRLRYAIEYLSDLYGKPAKEYVGRLVALQDLLGEHQDDYVSIELVHELAGEGANPEVAFSLGRLSERFSENAQELREAYAGTYKGVRGKSWTTLRDRLRDDLREGWRLLGPQRD